MTQQKLADEVDMNRNYLGLIESGRGNPSVDLLIRLARVLRISPGDLLDGKNLGQVEPGSD
jgi:transcriptional regulator with XRE-family HTH domain